jgi:hypothetical protein
MQVPFNLAMSMRRIYPKGLGAIRVSIVWNASKPSGLRFRSSVPCQYQVLRILLRSLPTCFSLMKAVYDQCRNQKPLHGEPISLPYGWMYHTYISQGNTTQDDLRKEQPHKFNTDVRFCSVVERVNLALMARKATPGLL